MILTLVGISYGTLDEAARRARGVGADIVVRPPGTSLIAASSSPMSEGLLAFFVKQPHVTFATRDRQLRSQANESGVFASDLSLGQRDVHIHLLP